MRYLLTTGHRFPKFYKADGTVIDLELKYVESKIISSIDENGQLNHAHISGTPPCVGSIWMVENVEQTLIKLESKGVYPYINKAAARENAKRLNLQTFKYIPVP